MDDEPFRGRRAVREGRLTKHRLRSRYRALYRDVYLANDVTVTAALRARAAWLWADGGCVLSGISAAAIHGTKWLDGHHPAELVRPDRHAPPGIRIRSYELSTEDVWEIDRMRVTSPLRTGFDIGRTLPRHRALPILDALIAATGIAKADLISTADAMPGMRGVRRLRATAALSDGGAESPQESRLRLTLIDGGLPMPETQIEFRDDYGLPFIRVDMGWREWKVAVEYDGVQHWLDAKQRAWDIERIALLEAMGWVVVRVSAQMLSRPGVIVDRVRTKLRIAGCPV